MQDGRLEVANVNWVGGNVVADVVGLAERLSPFDTAAGQKHGERIRMMVSADERLGFAVLLHGSPAKLTTPNDQGLIQEPALSQVLDQSGQRAVDLLYFDRQGMGDVLAGADPVVIPAPIIKLDEPDT